MGFIMDEDELRRKKREYLDKIKDKIDSVNIADRLAKRLIELERFFKEQGLLTDDIRKALVSIRAKIGSPEFIGAKGRAELEKKTVEIEIISVLKEKGGIVSVDDLKKELKRRGWLFSDYSIERIILNLVNKKVIKVKRGFIAEKNFRDTPIGKKVLSKLSELKRTNIDELSKLTNVDKKALRSIIEELNEIGVVSLDENDIYLIS